MNHWTKIDDRYVAEHNSYNGVIELTALGQYRWAVEQENRDVITGGICSTIEEAKTAAETAFQPLPAKKSDNNSEWIVVQHSLLRKKFLTKQEPDTPPIAITAEVRVNKAAQCSWMVYVYGPVVYEKGETVSLQAAMVEAENAAKFYAAKLKR